MYSEDGLLGWTHSVEEQAKNVSPEMVNINIDKARMKSSSMWSVGPSTINCALIRRQAMWKVSSTHIMSENFEEQVQGECYLGI